MLFRLIGSIPGGFLFAELNDPCGAICATSDGVVGDFNDQSAWRKDLCRMILTRGAGRSQLAMELDLIRNEITRLRGQIRAQEREIRLLQRMRAKLDELCRQRETLRGVPQRPQSSRSPGSTSPRKT